MSNYTRVENFTAKDSLESGDAEKIISGADIDSEFNAIATAIATKEDTGGVIPSGTKMLFVTSSAPTGWTLVTTYDDVVPIIQNAASIATGGNWTIGTSTLAGASGSHTHTYNHTHGVGNHVHAINNHTHSDGNYSISLSNGINVGGGGQYGSNSSSINVSGNSGNPNNLPNTDNPASGNRSNPNSATTGSTTSNVVLSGNAVDGNWRPAYLNTVICSKN